MQASRQACAACGETIESKTGGVTAGAIACFMPRQLKQPAIWRVNFIHKLHKPDGLLACGYCSRRGYAASIQVIKVLQ